jgi:hypothetical protein
MDPPGGGQSNPHREEQIENDESQNHGKRLGIGVGGF